MLLPLHLILTSPANLLTLNSRSEGVGGLSPLICLVQLSLQHAPAYDCLASLSVPYWQLSLECGGAKPKTQLHGV